MQSKKFRNKTTGEIVTQVPLMDIANYEEVLEIEITDHVDGHKSYATIAQVTDRVEKVAQAQAFIKSFMK